MSDLFFEEGSRLLTPNAFEFVLDGELKRAVRSQNFLTLVVLEAKREWEGLMVTADDGTRFVLTHMKRQLRGIEAVGETKYDVAVFGHTHKPRISTDEQGRLLINPGETSGWTFGRPTVVLLETATLSAQIVALGGDLQQTTPPPLPRGSDTAFGCSRLGTKTT